MYGSIYLQRYYLEEFGNAFEVATLLISELLKYYYYNLKLNLCLFIHLPFTVVTDTLDSEMKTKKKDLFRVMICVSYELFLFSKTHCEL